MKLTLALVTTLLSLSLPMTEAEQNGIRRAQSDDTHRRHRHRMMTTTDGKKGSGKKGYTAKSGKKSQAPVPEPEPEPEFLCNLFEAYQKTSRETSPSDWTATCAAFDSVDKYLCPDEEVVEELCAHPYKPHLNPAVRYEYCTPLFEGVVDEDRQVKCIRYCINYVSKSRGDCCGFECGDEYEEASAVRTPGIY